MHVIFLHARTEVEKEEQEGSASLCNPSRSLITSCRERSSWGREEKISRLVYQQRSSSYIIKHPYFHISLSPRRLCKSRST